jgi:hypothetical protein
LLSGLSGRSIALRNSLEVMKRIRHRASAHFIAAKVPPSCVNRYCDLRQRSAQRAFSRRVRYFPAHGFAG